MKENKFVSVQILWTAVLLALLTAAFFVFKTDQSRLVEAAKPLGAVMLLDGFVNLAVYFIKKDEIHGSRWLLADGLSTTLLALFPLFNDLGVAEIVVFFFGIWELFSGILKVLDAKELRGENVKWWQGFLAVGAVELISGTAVMIDPAKHIMSYTAAVSLVFLVQGVGFVFKICAVRRP